MIDLDIAVVKASDLEKVESDVVQMLQKIGVSATTVAEREQDPNLDDVVDLSLEDIALTEEDLVPAQIAEAAELAENFPAFLIASETREVEGADSSGTNFIDYVMPASYVLASLYALSKAAQFDVIPDNYGIILVISILALNAAITAWKFTRMK